MNSASVSIGSELDVKVGTVPAAVAAGTRNGAAINRFTAAGRANSCILFANSGAETGAPSSRTLDTKLQDSADGSTGWADLAGAATAQITAASSSTRKNVSLLSAKQYVRVVETTAFVAGTAPTLGVSTALVLGGFDGPLPTA